MWLREKGFSFQTLKLVQHCKEELKEIFTLEIKKKYLLNQNSVNGKKKS